MSDHSVVSYLVRPAYVALWMVAVALSAGCRDSTDNGVQQESPPKDAGPTALRLIVIDDQPLAEAIEREWTAQSQGELEVSSLTGDQFELEQAKNCDVLVFPTNWLGELAEAEAIRPLPPLALPGKSDAASNYDWNDVFGLIRRQEVRWGEDLYGVSFGSPQFVLVYRKDLFQQWELPVPTTWEEYGRTLNVVSKRIDQARANGKLTDCFASAEPLGDGWACRVLLARSAAYARHRSQYSTWFQFSTFEPLINRPPFVRALQELREAIEYQPPNVLELEPSDVMQQLLDGKLVMGVTWPRAQLQSQSAPDEGATIGFAELPGSREVYHLKADNWQPRTTEDDVHVPLLAIDGRIGALSRRTRSMAAATSFLLWLTDRQQSERISTRSRNTTMFRQSQKQTARNWVGPDLSSTAQEYADVVAGSQNRTSWLTLLRLPGQAHYLKSMDESIRTGLSEKTEPQQVLDAVADQWKAISNELGRDVQREAYLKSLGIQ